MAELFLKGLTSAPKRHSYAVYDIETTTDTENSYMVGFYDGESYRCFESAPGKPDSAGNCVDQFMRFLLENGLHTGKRIYAHNGGNFDALYLLRWLLTNQKRWSVEIVPIQSCILLLSVKSKRDKNLHWEFLDSSRLLPMSLEKAGQSFGLGGKVKGIDYETLHLDPKRYEYLETDCRLLYDCISKFREIIEALGGELGITTPATAMDTFRRRYLTGAIQVNKSTHSLAREAYYGGRTEVFKKHFVGHLDGTRLYYGDVNSMYPHAMLSHMPVGDCIRLKNLTTKEAIKLSEVRLGILKCTVVVPETCHIPPLPYRHEGKLIFPTGRFDGSWCWPELRALIISGGYIEKIHDSVWYKSRQVFVEYVHSLYALRDKTKPGYNEGLGTTAKLLLNSLYGKFGSRPEREKILIGPPGKDLETRIVKPFGDGEENIYLEETESYPSYIIPQISAYITSYARVLLWNLMNDIHISGHQIYYCDTDSIISTAPCTDSKALGALKLEKIWSYADFTAPKLYHGITPDGATYTKAKGFSHGFGGLPITATDYAEIVEGNPITAKKFTKCRSALKGANFPALHDTQKSLHDSIGKRIFVANESYPIHIGE